MVQPNIKPITPTNQPQLPKTHSTPTLKASLKEVALEIRWKYFCVSPSTKILDTY